ncbi:MAG TPA: anti-sigma factor [Terriglobales bacterium]|nr:anti-sigma factor [Terriglobales bacterium]
MICTHAKSLLSPYLDGAVTGKQMRALSTHLDECPRCRQEYVLLRETQQLLAGIGRRKAPPDLALKLRVAISREAAPAKRARFDGFVLRLQNALRAFMVPATAGIIAAVLVFVFVMGFLTLPELEARNNDDVPLMLYTAPELQQSAFGTELTPISEDSLVIEAYVDANGRVEDYRILSNPGVSKDLLFKVKNMLIFTTFRPAMSMGRPTPGTAVLSFSKVSVKG